MNYPLSSHLMRSPFVRFFVVVIACTSMSVLVGCGDSEPQDAAVVTPPGPTQTPAESSSSEAPGDIVMPDEGIQDSADQSTGVGEGGLEMPPDAQIPELEVV